MIHPRVLLVTPDALLASSLVRVLAELYRIITPATPQVLSCLEELPSEAESPSDLLLVDVRHLAPVEVAAFVARLAPRPVVLIAPRGLRTAAIPAHVRGALSHLSDLHEVRVALDVVKSGQRYLSPHFAAEDRLRYWQLPAPPTERQRHVCERKQRGMTNTSIAVALCVTRKAVEAMATELRAALGVPAGESFDWRDGRLP